MIIPFRIVKFLYEGENIGAVSIFKRQVNADFDLVMECPRRDRRSDNMKVVQFLYCKMSKIPLPRSILNHVPNLQVLKISNVPLNSISKADFEGYECLKDLIIIGTNIQFLPGNVFESTPNLEVINFKGNRIKHIDERIIWSFSRMKYIDLTENVNINVKFDRIHGEDHSVGGFCVTFGQLENEIKTKCMPPLKVPTKLPLKWDREISPTNATIQGSELSNDADDEDIDLAILETEHYEELKEKIDQEAKLRRGLRMELLNLGQKLEELKGQVQNNSKTCNDEANQVDAEIKQLTDLQKKFNEDIEKKIIEVSERVTAISTNCELFEKNFNDLNQGLEACKKENQEAVKKLTDEIESLTKKCAEFQKGIDDSKKALESQQKYVKDLVKVILTDNKKKLHENDLKLRQEIAEANKKCEKQSKELNLVIQSHVAVLKADFEKKLDEIPAKRQRLEEYKIILGAEEFKVHKSFLLAHSPKIASMVRENPQMETFELKEEEISVESFKEILNFMYLGVAPSPQSNLISLYAASCHLEINTLATIVAGMLKEKIDPDNAFEILIYCNEYGKEELKMKAFEEFSKNFPKQKLAPEIASQPQVLAKLNAAKMEVESILHREA